MVSFIIRRMLQSIGAIFFASLVLHTILLVMLPERFYSQSRARLQALGTDIPTDFDNRPPWPGQYLLWLFNPNDTMRIDKDYQEVRKGIDVTIGSIRIQGSGALTGDFGESRLIAGQNLTVGEVISTRWGNTLALVLAALIPTVLIAVPLGVFAAARQNSPLDNGVTFMSVVGLSLPPYWPGLMLVLFLAVTTKELNDAGWSWLPYLPPGNVVSTGQDENAVNRVYHLVLPALTLALSQIAALSRHVRFAMLEVMKKEYVRTAWAKGLPRRRVLFRHAFRNAIIAVITTITLVLPSMVSGAIVVETVFAYTGMGQLFFKSIGGALATERQTFTQGGMDYSLAMALMLLMVVIVVVSNLVADLLYTFLHPRLRTG